MHTDTKHGKHRIVTLSTTGNAALNDVGKDFKFCRLRGLSDEQQIRALDGIAGIDEQGPH